MRKLFLKTWNIAFKRGWNKVFIAVDIHDVILEANYKAGDIPKTFLGMAKEVLQRLSKRSDVILILYTCSHPNEIIEYLEFFRENDIFFKHVNCNPDCPNTAFGCFDTKFYYNIMLEDKAGFVPEEWEEINLALNTIDKVSIVEYKGENILVDVLSEAYCFPFEYGRDLSKVIKVAETTFIAPLDLSKNTTRVFS